MCTTCLQLHQSPFAVAGIQAESYPYGYRRGNNAEAYTYPLVNAEYIHNGEKQKHAEQTSCENEQIPALQSLKLGTATDTFVDRVFSHSLQKERTQNSGSDYQEDARPEPIGSRLTRIRIAG